MQKNFHVFSSAILGIQIDYLLGFLGMDQWLSVVRKYFGGGKIFRKKQFFIFVVIFSYIFFSGAVW
jgi:hypothetical protein